MKNNTRITKLAMGHGPNDYRILNEEVAARQQKEKSEEPNEEMSPRGDKKDEALLKADNGTREGLPESFNKGNFTPHGVNSDIHSGIIISWFPGSMKGSAGYPTKRTKS